LASDSAVTGGEGRWRAEVGEEWEIWGANGGYLATIALRAAAAHSGMSRPASLECHFLGTARPGPVSLTTETLRLTGRAHSVRVCMRQADRPILEALIWTIADGLDGLPRRAVAAPDCPRPQSLKSVTDLLPPERRRDGKFWQLVEERPVRPEDYLDWPERPWDEPLLRTWLRFRSKPAAGDPFVTAGSAAIAVDVFPFAAAARVLRAEQVTHMAPTISLSVAFHSPREESEWLLLYVDSPFTGDGLISGRASVWTEGGELLATGSTQMLCRSWR
jgi:acyl-CoA thioesterase